MRPLLARFVDFVPPDAALMAATLATTVAEAADDFPAGERVAPGTLTRGPDPDLLHTVGKTIVPRPGAGRSAGL